MMNTTRKFAVVAFALAANVASASNLSPEALKEIDRLGFAHADVNGIDCKTQLWACEAPVLIAKSAITQTDAPTVEQPMKKEGMSIQEQAQMYGAYPMILGD